MGNIFKIFLNDLKSISKNIIVFIVIIGISILPALYAWFNIAANWDPYSSTGGIPFAVCSNDKGATFNIVMSVNAGDKIIDNLKKNDKMGWDFVSENDAIEGVKSGKYYAAVVIPADFSENLLSVISGKFTQAELHYYVNEKINAISPKITSKGVEAIQTSINSTYVNTITTTIASTLNLATGSLSGVADNASDKVISSMETVRDSIDGLKTTVDVFISSVNTMEEALKASKETLPNIDQSLAKAGVVTDNIKDSIGAAKSVSVNVTKSLEEVLDSAQSYSQSAAQRINDAADSIETNSSAAAENLRSATVIGERIISVDERVLASLESLEGSFDLDLSKVTAKLKSNIDQWETINSKINNAADTIKTTGSLPKDRIDELNDLLVRAETGISGAKEAFKGVESTIDSAIDHAFTIIDSASDFLQSVSADIPDFTSTIDEANTTLENLKLTLENVKEYMDGSKERIDNLIETIKRLESNDAIGNMIKPIIENPQALGDFIADPVTTKETRLFPIENYGSCMTPFYSSLAFWVGGVVLVAVLRTDLTKKESDKLRRKNSTQLFFGRYIMFFMLGQIQALIISMGDLFFLKIQCDNPFLFVLSSMISSFVYTLIIYS